MNAQEVARRFDAQSLAQEAGVREFNGPQMIYRPKPRKLVAATGVGAGWSGRVRVQVPDSRCRIKLSVIFFPKAGKPIPNALKHIGSIWVAGYDEDTDGISGSAGTTQPVQDVEGSEAAAGTDPGPTAFPVTQGLAGYSREFVTAADWLEAVVTIGSNALVVGQWVLQTRLQPDAGALFSWQEWDQIRRNFDPQAFGSGRV